MKKRYPTFQTEVLDHYPHLNDGQQLGVLEACPFLPLHKLQPSKVGNEWRNIPVFTCFWASTVLQSETSIHRITRPQLSVSWKQKSKQWLSKIWRGLEVTNFGRQWLVSRTSLQMDWKANSIQLGFSYFDT